MGLAPKTATLLKDGVEIEMPVDDMMAETGWLFVW
jgi:hypothetical protein